MMEPPIPNAKQIAIVTFCTVVIFFTIIGFSFKAFHDRAEREGRNFFDNDTPAASSVAPSFSEEKRITVNGALLKLELAETDRETQQGLSDRLSMNADEGMLFYLNDAAIHPFWMLRMHFPIDMIWIRDGIVVEIAPNMPPPSETMGIPKTYTPKVEADMVLELTAGGAERYGLTVGDRIDI